MNAIIFHVRQPAGGLGDRIVGLVSTMFIARVLNRQLGICWEWPDISHCIDYEHTELDPKVLLDTVRHFDTIDRLKSWEPMIKQGNLEGLFGNGPVAIACNQNIAQYLWLNWRYRPMLGDYMDEMRAAYRSVFRDWLRPKFKHQQFDVGIQVRVGDVAMGVGDYECQTLDQVRAMLEQIKPRVEGKRVFVTSDSDAAHRLMVDLSDDTYSTSWPDCDMVHVDRNPTVPGTIRAFKDMFTLSACRELYITEASNFGRVPALMSHANVWCWNGHELKPADMRALTSKEGVVA